jgi:hypothetical protein
MTPPTQHDPPRQVVQVPKGPLNESADLHPLRSNCAAVSLAVLVRPCADAFAQLAWGGVCFAGLTLAKELLALERWVLTGVDMAPWRLSLALVAKFPLVMGAGLTAAPARAAGFVRLDPSGNPVHDSAEPSLASLILAVRTNAARPSHGRRPLLRSNPRLAQALAGVSSVRLSRSRVFDTGLYLKRLLVIEQPPEVRARARVERDESHDHGPPESSHHDSSTG